MHQMKQEHVKNPSLKTILLENSFPHTARSGNADGGACAEARPPPKNGKATLVPRRAPSCNLGKNDGGGGGCGADVGVWFSTNLIMTEILNPPVGTGVRHPTVGSGPLHQYN